MFDKNKVPVYLFVKCADGQRISIVVPFSMVEQNINALDFQNQKTSMLVAWFPKKSNRTALKTTAIYDYLEKYTRTMLEEHKKSMSTDDVLTYRHLSNPHYRFLGYLQDNRIDMLTAHCTKYPHKVYINGEVRELLEHGSVCQGVGVSNKRLSYTGVYSGESIVLLSPPTVKPPSNFEKQTSLFDILKIIDRNYALKGDSVETLNETKVEPVMPNLIEKSLMVSFARDVYILEQSIPNNMAYEYNDRAYPVLDFDPKNFDTDYLVDEFLEHFYANGLVEISPTVMVPFRQAVKNDWMIGKVRKIVAEYLGVESRFLNLARPYDCHGSRLSDNNLQNYYLHPTHREKLIPHDS